MCPPQVQCSANRVELADDRLFSGFTVTVQPFTRCRWMGSFGSFSSPG
jgi:hypothetical protein